MNKDFSDKVKILQQKIPVSTRQGLIILAKTNGDIEQAEILFKTGALNLIIRKTNLSQEAASKFLIKNNFDIDITLKNINEEKYSITERIFKKYKDNKEEALRRIAFAVEEKQKLERNYWLNFKGLEKLNPKVFTLVTIMEWINYEDWKTLEPALYFNLDIVVDQIEKQLHLPQVAQTLRKAKDIEQAQIEQQNAILKETGFLAPTSEFTEQRII